MDTLLFHEATGEICEWCNATNAGRS